MDTSRADMRQAWQIARERLGYEQLRPGQAAAIQALLEGQDTLAVLPTGSGKSAIYQIAGMLLPRATVVISPLLALHQDQVESIEEQQMAAAAPLNSTMSASERREAFEGFTGGDLDFLLLAPEQLASEETLTRLREAHPSLFVVDEAHCISEWGHDFRPEYLRLGTAIEALGHPITLALTATASLPVREEIVERLGMRHPRVVVHGFDRPNIWLGVEEFTDERTKRRALVARVGEAEKPGIVYVTTRRHAEEVAATLRADGVEAVAYHAGMAAGEREEIQRAFMGDVVPVIVATIAFGLGIDKPNVRFVFHYDVSDSLDAYYQQVGRAGRDDAPAKAILFYRPEDLGLQRFLSAGVRVSPDQVQRTAEAIQEHGGPVDLEELRDETGLSQPKLMAAVTGLQRAGAVETCPSGEVAPSDAPPDPRQAEEAAAHAHMQQRTFQRSQLEMMQGYATTQDCRRRYLLAYFGEAYDGSCGCCDNCEAGTVVAEGREPFPLNSRVRHRKWGEGSVMHYEGDKMTVLFDTVGYKTLAIDLVTDSGLLEPAQ